MKIKKNDQVYITAGKDRGKRGKVVRVLPEADKVIVEGINIHKKHVKSKKQGVPGERVEIAAPIHISNVMLVCPETDRPTRIGLRVTEAGKVRVSKRSGKEL
ncbi:MAG: 50S ribosomal protein L24 [Candidatus Moraniibacteriota bacterium]